MCGSWHEMQPSLPALFSEHLLTANCSAWLTALWRSATSAGNTNTATKSPNFSSARFSEKAPPIRHHPLPAFRGAFPASPHPHPHLPPRPLHLPPPPPPPPP